MNGAPPTPPDPTPTQAQYEEEMIAQVMKAKPDMTRERALDWLKQMENL